MLNSSTRGSTEIEITGESMLLSEVTGKDSLVPFVVGSPFGNRTGLQPIKLAATSITSDVLL